MSKIGKINISIPEKVKVALTGNNVNIEGPLGKKSLTIDLENFDYWIPPTQYKTNGYPLVKQLILQLLQ